QTRLPGKTYSAQLIPTIVDLLKTHRSTIADLEAIIVTGGPGSFTGIRIALSTAKGLAEAHGTPILAVSRLAVLAYKAATTAAVLDASRHEFYLGDFSSPTPRESLVSADLLLAQAQRLAQNLAVCEASVHAVASGAILVEPPTAADALQFALPRLRTRDFDNAVTLDGNYLRRSDAEIFSKPHP
ncbi:MAG: tRNA (adenosine(37)-N6)-threonylcarbamoyltransferase complex dimerization subunit type 1 TsaB, partial [Acidobacteriaceae bacterium]